MLMYNSKTEYMKKVLLLLTITLVTFTGLQSCKSKTEHYVVTVTGLDSRGPDGGLSLHTATKYSNGSETKVWVPAALEQDSATSYIANVDKEPSQQYGTVVSVPFNSKAEK